MFDGVIPSLVAWWVSVMILKIPTLRKKHQIRNLLLKESFLYKKGKWEKALEVCDDVICKLKAEKEGFFSEESISKVFLAKGNCLRNLDRLEEAIVAYDQVIREFGKVKKLSLQESTMKALVGEGDCLVKLVNKEWNLRRLHYREKAIAVYDEVIHMEGVAKQLALREQVAKALMGKGNVLSDKEEALAAYDEVIHRYGKSKQLALREQVAKALMGKGNVLSDKEEALAAYDEVIHRYGKSKQLALREQVAKALLNKADLLSKLDRCGEAFTVYDEVICWFGHETEYQFRESVIKALFNKGACLSKLGRWEEALIAYDSIIHRFEKAQESLIHEYVIRARKTLIVMLSDKGITFGRAERWEEALAVYNEIIRRCDEAEEVSLRKRVAKAIFNKAVSLSKLGRWEEALEVYSDVIHKFGGIKESSLFQSESLFFQIVVKSLINKGVLLQKHDSSKNNVYENVLLWLVMWLHKNFPLYEDNTLGSPEGKSYEEVSLWLKKRFPQSLPENGHKIDYLEQVILVYNWIFFIFNIKVSSSLRDYVDSLSKTQGFLL